MFYNDSGKSLTLVSNCGVKCAVFPFCIVVEQKQKLKKENSKYFKDLLWYNS